MQSSVTRLVTALLGIAAFAAAHAQASYSCANDAPNTYRLVTGWADTPRHWAHPLALDVDAHDNLWAFDRCEEAGCAASTAAPVFQLSPSGKLIKNFGAGLFIYPHAIAADKDGNVWAVDGNVKDGRGNQVIKLGPDGKVLMRLGKAGQGIGSKALDTFDQPTGVAVASNGDIFVAEGHAPGLGNSRIMKFTKDGKFIKTFATVGSGDGQLKEPHAIAIDSRDRLFVADRRNFRVVIFDKDGHFIAAWKQFGIPSGVAVKNDLLYVADSQSSNDPKSAAYNACKPGIRIGSVKDGKVTAYIPPPPVADPNMPPAEGVAVDSHGVVYAAANQQNDVKKFVKN
jgi:sugar lactone lactonase YvrE